MLIIKFLFIIFSLGNQIVNVNISLTYQNFERYIQNNLNSPIFQNRYKQNLFQLAKINIHSGCDKKVFNLPLKNYFSSWDKIFGYFFRCFLEKQKKYISARIVTNKVYFRLHNIKVALKHLDWKIWKLWENFDIVEFLKKYEKEYINWEGIYRWKVVMIKWGGLCGLATVLYQLAIKTPDIKVIERHPHTYFYQHYYNLTWLDATVFFTGWIVKNLVLENNHYDWFFKTFWQETKDNFIYEVRFYSLKSFVENNIQIGKVYLSWDKKCVDVWIENDKLWYKDKIVSCYKGIFR